MSSRWDELAADISARADAQEHAARTAEAADLTRADLGAIGVLDRLRAAAGAHVRLDVVGAGTLAGVVSAVGRDVVVVQDATPGRGTPRELIVPLVALLSVHGLGSAARTGRLVGPVDERLGLAHLLRRSARDRVPVQVVLSDGAVVLGTVDMVGADHLELAEHPGDVRRRRSQVTGHRVVPFSAVGAVVRPLPPPTVR